MLAAHVHAGLMAVVDLQCSMSHSPMLASRSLSLHQVQLASGRCWRSQAGRLQMNVQHTD